MIFIAIFDYYAIDAADDAITPPLRHADAASCYASYIHDVSLIIAADAADAIDADAAGFSLRFSAITLIITYCRHFSAMLFIICCFSPCCHAAFRFRYIAIHADAMPCCHAITLILICHIDTLLLMAAIADADMFDYDAYYCRHC